MSEGVVDDLSLRMSGLDPRSVHVRFVVHTVALGQVFVPALRFYLVNIFPQMLHVHIHVNTSLIRTSGRSLERSNNAALYRNVLLHCFNVRSVREKLALEVWTGRSQIRTGSGVAISAYNDEHKSIGNLDRSNNKQRCRETPDRVFKT